MQELYKRYRPKNLKEIVGQGDAISIINGMINGKGIPHTILLSGPSGCGKTTIARILRRNLNCSKEDFFEINCADFRGIDTIRDIRSRMMLAPFAGETRVYLIDECHKLTSDAQTALLKMLEDTPNHVYFILATTDPQRLIKTVITRCTEIRLKSVEDADLIQLIKSISSKESKEVEEEVVYRIMEVADGSPRKALVILEQVINIDGTENRLNTILASDLQTKGIDIARCIFNPTSSWSDVSKIIKSIDDDPESVRHVVLGYANAILLGGGKMADFAFTVINAFRDNWYDCKKSGLIASCWEVFLEKRKK